MKTLLKGMLLAAGLALGANTVLAAEGDWIETHLKGKIGRNTPMETDRLDAERASQASRIEPSGPPAVLAGAAGPAETGPLLAYGRSADPRRPSRRSVSRSDRAGAHVDRAAPDAQARPVAATGVVLRYFSRVVPGVLFHSASDPSYIFTSYPRYFSVKYAADDCMPELQYVTTGLPGASPAAW